MLSASFSLWLSPARRLAMYGWVVVAAAAAVSGAVAGADGMHEDALAVMAARQQLVGLQLWPGFAALDSPLAIYDGESTLLVDHPSPPPEFEPLQDARGVLVMTGRHPGVSANSSALIGGVATATLMLPSLDGDDRSAVLAVAVHEAFHVYQGERHPGWVADETQLFLYPVDDAELLSLRRAESLAWRRALLTDEPLPWAALALDLRRQLNDRRSDGAVAYERGLELYEGLARYVQDRCLPDRPPQLPPAQGWPAEVVRERAYVTGAAMAHLLDDLVPQWKQQLEEDDSPYLDDLLGWALAERSVTPASIDSAEREVLVAAAGVDAAAVSESRQASRVEFYSRAGPAIVVRVLGGGPLSPQGFDPLNVRSLGGRDVLHTRWLKLERHDAEIEIEGCSVLTSGAGSHPLFGGVSELLVTGLKAPPELDESGDETVVSAPGFLGRFGAVTIERQQHVLIISLP
jgi:hypothetical protein